MSEVNNGNYELLFCKLLKDRMTLSSLNDKAMQSI